MQPSGDVKMSLHKAVIDGMTDVVEAILLRGADPNQRDEETGRTVAHCAVKMSNIGMLQLLKEHGANMSIFDNRSNTPLSEAVQEGKVQVVQWLLDNLPQNMNVIQDMLSLAAACGQVTVISTLLARGVGIDSKDELGRNALFFAAENGQNEAVSFLLQRGANPAACDNYNKTLLHAAAESGQTKTIDLILNYCQHKIDVKDRSGDTPLHCAATTNKEAVAFLVNHGANVDLRNFQGYTPLDLAMQAKKVDITNFLWEVDISKMMKDL